MVQTIGKVSLTVAVIGGFVAFAAQSLMFQKGNFSERDGEVFIPMLGQHGIYTTRLLGTAWYVGGALFLVGGLLTVVTATIDRRTSR